MRLDEGKPRRLPRCVRPRATFVECCCFAPPVFPVPVLAFRIRPTALPKTTSPGGRNYESTCDRDGGRLPAGRRTGGACCSARLSEPDHQDGHLVRRGWRLR